jgi:hypothetical protein
LIIGGKNLNQIRFKVARKKAGNEMTSVKSEGWLFKTRTTDEEKAVGLEFGLDVDAERRRQRDGKLLSEEPVVINLSGTDRKK